MPTRKLVLLLSLSLWVVSPLSHSQADLVARIVSASGGVEVVRANGSREEVVRRDGIRQGDRIVTGEDGLVQLRFVDSAIVSLRCNSSLSIDAYQYETGAGDRVELTLQAGSLRTLTGKIANADYRLLIADSVVSGSDADFEVAVTEDGSQYFGAYDGAMLIEHAEGRSRLGAGANTDFGLLAPGYAFEELSQQPTVLGSSVLLVQNSSNNRGSTNCAG